MARTAPPGILAGLAVALEKGSGYRVLGSSRIREVGLAELPEYGQVVIKRYLSMGWPKALWMALRGSQWKREWRTAQLLRELGVPTAEPLVMGDRLERGIPIEGVIVSRAIENGRTLREEIAAEGTEPHPLLEELGRLLARIHGLGVLHKDLHAENLLVVNRGQGRPEFWLLDLHRVRTGRPLGPAPRQWNLAQLLVSLRGRLGPGEDRLLLESYLRASGLGGLEDSWARSIDSIQERMARNHHRSRTRRCLRDSSGFAVESLPGGRVIRVRGFPLEGVLRAMEEAASVRDPGDARALKITDSTRVTQQEITVGGSVRRLCIKEHRRHGPVSCFLATVLTSRARRFWVGAWGLVVRGFQVPAPMAMWEMRVDRCFSSGVVMEMVGNGIGLDRFLASLWPEGEGCREFMKELACTLARMHAAGVFHRDLKAGNILVRLEKGGHGVLFLDLEDVRFQKKVTRAQMALNLAQLDASIPHCVGRLSRLRFLCLYGKGCWHRGELRRVARKVWRLSQARREVGA